jgi:ABC-type dipeptide/oligopeptide/nickel transport system permease subunit
VSLQRDLVPEPEAVLTRWHDLGWRLRHARRGNQVALVCFVALFVGCLVGPWFAPYDPVLPVGAPFERPSSTFWFGTDDIGEDIFSRVLYGARQSWLSALVVIASGVFVGTAVGLVAGSVGGWVDSVLMRTTDAFLALPAPVLALAVAAALGRSQRNLLIAVAIVWWPLYARIVRGEVRALTSRPHVEAARLAGTRGLTLWRRHLLPGAVPPILIAASLDIGGLILTIAGLSFLGLGAPLPAPELGGMTAQGLPYLLSSSWVALFPALAIFLIALTSNFAGDAVRDLFDR